MVLLKKAMGVEFSLVHRIRLKLKILHINNFKKGELSIEIKTAVVWCPMVYVFVTYSFSSP